MDQLYNYFRDLAEGRLDITKTVEFQFIKALQEMETPIGLEEFAAQVNLTSIILKFLGLTTNAGIFTQSQFGLDTNIKGSLDIKDPVPSSPSPPEPVSESPPVQTQEPPQTTQAPPVFVPSRTPGDSLPERTESTSRPQAVALKPVPKGGDKLDNAFEMDLPGHIKDRLNFERSRVGSKKSDDGSDGLSDLFDQLGSLADELEED